MLREFQTFEDKANAIKLTGVDDQLAKMIKKWLLPNQKLAVGKLEYKTCLEANLVSVKLFLFFYLCRRILSIILLLWIFSEDFMHI